MRGYRVPRKAGWDCHGLPVELEVEKELGISSKQEVEEYGIAEFNQRCRESVFEYVEEWNRLTERIGFWIDLDDPYVTLDDSYIESVWWSLRRLWEADLLYEGHKVVPYCPRCGTALSSHEVALGYEDVEDPSVYVSPIPAAADDEIPESPLQPGDELLDLDDDAVDADLATRRSPSARRSTYVRAPARRRGPGARRDLVERVLGEDAEILDHFPGSAPGRRRLLAAVFDYVTDFGPRGHTVLEADFVTAEEGPASSTPRSPSARTTSGSASGYELTKLQNPVALDGTFDDRVTDFAGQVRQGRRPRDRRRPRAFRPAVPRSAGLRARLSALLALRDAAPLLRQVELVRATSRRSARSCSPTTSEIGWHPEHIKHGRFGKWLENNVDWALSRDRYWGTPLPIWECGGEGCEERFCAGSVAELRERATGEVPDDLHRPYIDEVGLRCESCGGEMRRVDSVIDTWYDSGAMPFAQFHYPFENEEHSRSASPPTSSARRSTRPAAGSTPCWPSRPCCSNAPAIATASASA